MKARATLCREHRTNRAEPDVPDNPHASTIVGRVDVFHLQRDGERRAIRIYVPPDYESTSRHYPVIYMFDGHNLFDRRTSSYDQEWCVDETMERLYDEDPTLPAIVVGVDPDPATVARYREYSIGRWELPELIDSPHPETIVGAGQITADFLIHQVKPWVEANYRISTDRLDTAIAGSSMGGYMSLLLGAQYPEVFHKVLAFSPAILDYPMRSENLRELVRTSDASKSQRVYLDMGSAEQLEYIDHTTELTDSLEPMRQALLASGRSDVTIRIIPGATHDETAWARRFAEVFMWAFYDRQLSDQ